MQLMITQVEFSMVLLASTASSPGPTPASSPRSRPSSPGQVWSGRSLVPEGGARTVPGEVAFAVALITPEIWIACEDAASANDGTTSTPDPRLGDGHANFSTTHVCSV